MSARRNILHFNDGQLTQTVKILVNGDTKFEGNESFFVNLSNATNGATITQPRAVGTITNDDAAPVAGSISIGDVSTSKATAAPRRRSSRSLARPAAARRRST